MSTNFLNRRMDLIHKCNTLSISNPSSPLSGTDIVIPGGTVNGDGINYLTMDTSYPVKLAGKVIKIFTADSGWSGKKWILRNSEKEEILTVEPENVFDFAGRVIKDNIGDGLPYETSDLVYKMGDYVMVIIDFDEELLYLCSQTNFENFITGGGDGNLKLFEIDGDTSPESSDINFDYAFNNDIFKEAVEFELEDGKHSFTRFSEDEVLYETPKEEYDEEDDTLLIGRSITPVAKIESINVNKLTAVVNQFMFPYMDNVNIDEKGGTESINKLIAFMKINGNMNEQFINDFCYTESEMLSLPIITTATPKMKHNMLEEYYNIPESNRSQYRYVLMTLVNDNEFSTDRYDKNVRFIPINSSSRTFPSLFEINNRGFVVDGESVEIPANVGIYGNGVGQLEDNDLRDCYSIYHYSCGYNIFFTNYNKDNINSVDSSSGYGYTTSNTYIYIGDDDVNQGNGIVQTNKWYDFFEANDMLNDTTRFIEFFDTNDVSGWGDNATKLKDTISKFMSQTNGSVHTVYMDGTEINQLSKTVVLEYPEIFDEPMKNSDSTMKDYTLDNVDDFDRTKVRFKNRVSPKNHYNNMSIVYKLFNTAETTGYIDNEKISDVKKCEMLFTDDENETPTDVKYVFNASRSLSTTGTSIDDYNYGILSYGGNVVLSPINILSVNKIDVKKGNDKDYNPVEVSVNEFIVAKVIKRARDYIIADNINGDLSYYPNGVESATRHNLYVVARCDNNTTESGIANLTYNGNKYVMKKANINDTRINFKSPGTDHNGKYLYMYYSDTDGWHRIKYYYRNMTRNIEQGFDYFTDNIVIDNMNRLKNESNESIENLNRLNKDNIYIRAYLNYVANGSSVKQAMNNIPNDISSSSIIITVAAVYGLAVTTPSENGNSYMRCESDMLDFTSTYNLTIDIDDKIIYPGCKNDAGVYGYKSIRLSNMIDSSTNTFHKNMMVPLLSDTRNSNGGLIWNIKTYLAYIKKRQFNTLTNSNTNNPHRRINIAGIPDEIINLNMFDFYKRALVCDLSKPLRDSSAYFDKVETYDRALFRRSLVDKLSFALTYDSTTKKSVYMYCDNTNEENVISLTTKDNNGIVLHSNLNPRNIFDINYMTIENSESVDVTSSYVDDISAWINHNQTGKRESYSLSLSDGDPFNLTLLPLSGNEGSIDCDDIIWNDLIIALSNNQTINILSDSLKNIKNDINTMMTNTAQNISDTITMQENLHTSLIAANTDDPFPADRHDLDKYRQPEGTPAGTYNSDYGVYEFHFGYGYEGPTYGRWRTLNNRGVIVFVTDGGNSYMSQGSGDVYDVYNETSSVIQPKRMYINKDGILCTKEYFDKETEIYTPDDSSVPSYPDTIVTIAELLKRIEELETKVAELTN